ncbi:hypothetical protein Fmac_003323 [Flemingia macrophylla]|uniref:Protein kinase domain-containing protein n=1 Tax=Flemingia macrophylla TaxID=520843 RepID=A0ABD1NPB7_9FABA
MLMVILMLMWKMTRSNSSEGCSSRHRECPPFPSNSSPPFPFSARPGCGHPSFRLTCATPHSRISINNRSLCILSYNPNTSTITTRCSSSFNLSASPFRLSSSHCHTNSNTIQLQWDPTHDPYFTNCTTCHGLCGFNSSSPTKPFLCLRPQHSSPSLPKLFTTLIALASLLILLSAATAILRAARPTSHQDPTTLFLHRHLAASLLPPPFAYDDLAASTHNFHPSRKIGDGGFGSVYLAHQRDGTLAAVKYLHRHRASAAFSSKSFCNEILILSSINHPNLVKLHGYCSDPRGLLLVYDYIPNGTLADHLHKRKGSLTWRVRLDMALQTALAMEYLHFSVVPPVVHRDITSSNIFVERDMRIKVGDFGLSRVLVVPSSSNGSVWTGPQGTPGYLDPDYHRSFRLTEKSDVYSFGVVLFELISGLRALDQTRDKRDMALADFVVSRIQMGQLHQVLDPALAAGDSVAAVAELAFRCVAADKDDRPDSREVVEELKRVRNRTKDND